MILIVIKVYQWRKTLYFDSKALSIWHQNVFRQQLALSGGLPLQIDPTWFWITVPIPFEGQQKLTAVRVLTSAFCYFSRFLCLDILRVFCVFVYLGCVFIYKMLPTSCLWVVYIRDRPERWINHPQSMTEGQCSLVKYSTQNSLHLLEMRRNLFWSMLYRLPLIKYTGWSLHLGHTFLRILAK